MYAHRGLANISNKLASQSSVMPISNGRRWGVRRITGASKNISITIDPSGLDQTFSPIPDQPVGQTGIGQGASSFGYRFGSSLVG